MSVRSLVQNQPHLFAALLAVRDRLALGQEPELALVPALCERGMEAFDIGANTGVYTFRIAQHARRVIAFEPNPRAADLLRLRFARQIALRRIAVDTSALSDEEGVSYLCVPPDAPALASIEPTVVERLGGDRLRVEKRRLDSYAAHRVGFIKIDVEGHECAVIRSGLSLIARDRPNLLIEAEERHHPGTIEDLRAMLEPLGYSGFFMAPPGDDDGLAARKRRLAEIGSFHRGMQQREMLNAPGTSRRRGQNYVNNFLFIARREAIERVFRAAEPSS